MSRYHQFYAIFLLLLCSCGIANSEEDREWVCDREEVAGQLFPLHVGNYWDFQEISPVGSITDTVRFEIVREVTIDDYLESETLFGGNWHSASELPGNRLELYSNQDDGVHRSGLITDDTVAVDFLAYPYPQDPGHSFYWYSYSFDESSGEHVVVDSTEVVLVDTEDVVETPVGEFATYTYRYYLPPPVDDAAFGDYAYLHIAPGIGLVEFAFYGPFGRDDPPSRRSTLVDYCLMKQK